MTCLTLSKAGYGSFKEIQSLDAPEYLDMVEHYTISNAIESYQMKEARHGA